MNDDKRLIFYIDAYSPETIPMAKLAEYMADFLALLGKGQRRPFRGPEKGQHPAGRPRRIRGRAEGDDPPARYPPRQSPEGRKLKIFEQIDKRLANDNANGRIFVEGEESAPPVELLEFPGRDRPKAQTYGPITQEGNLDGILIAVGGKDETVPLRLQNGETTYTNCDTTRMIAARPRGSTCSSRSVFTEPADGCARPTTA